MSEYEYYEFQAVDRPLTEADRTELRALSSRARITSASFTNHYEWGDFRGDPLELMERWFDLHLYFANWGTRRLMMKLPSRLVDRQRLEGMLSKVEWAELKPSHENLILDIVCDDEERQYDLWFEGEDSDLLAAIAPLRDDVLGGDLRLFYLLWLAAVELGDIGPDEPEPLSGIGPLTGALEAFGEFFRIDPDLVAVAAERLGQNVVTSSPPEAKRRVIDRLSDHEKTELLGRAAEGDPHVATELRSRVRRSLVAEVRTVHSAATSRTAGELLKRTDEVRRERERIEAETAAAAQRRQAEEEAKARRARLDAIMKRGTNVWREVEVEIARRNPKGYDNAIDLLLALKDVAEEAGTAADFMHRLAAIREEHANKMRFVERLARFE
jgi:hypothetical protein